MSRRSIETKITNLETKLVNIDSKLDQILKHLASNNQTKPSIVEKSPKKVAVVRTSRPSSAPTSDKILLTEYGDDIILVTGDTYDSLHLLKPYRAKWEPEKKGWSIYTKNITNYSSFKNNLQSNCNKLTIRPTSKPFKVTSDIPKKHSMVSSNTCQIESSSDED